MSILAHWLRLSLSTTAIGTWDNLYTKHQLRDSDITLDRVYAMISEFLIELKLNEEQAKITQIMAGANRSQMKPTAYDEYVNASKGKVQKGKGKGAEGKGNKQNWRQPYSDYWSDGCGLGHNCPRCRPRRQPGRCTIRGSTKHFTSQCQCPVKPKAKNVEYEEDPTWHADAEFSGRSSRHDTKNMKNFTLHFEDTAQCEALDRLWLSSMVFSGEELV